MSDLFARTKLLLGKENMESLYHARVAVFGIGGVGSYTVEALARSGVGTLDLIDHDRVCSSNINRQIIATNRTLGKYKVDVAKERILDINPCAVVNVYRTFYLPETAVQFDLAQYDYVVDAIDTVTGKLHLVAQAQQCGVPIISCMGAGNKLDPTAFQVADISETSVCPLAKVRRRELKKRGIYHLKVVFSKEKPVLLSEYSVQNDGGGSVCSQEGQKRPELSQREMNNNRKKQMPGSVAFVPSVAGLIMAGEVIKDLTVTKFQ